MASEFGGVILQPSCKNRCFFCGGIHKVSNKELRKQELKVAKNLKELKKEY